MLKFYSDSLNSEEAIDSKGETNIKLSHSNIFEINEWINELFWIFCITSWLKGTKPLQSLMQLWMKYVWYLNDIELQFKNEFLVTFKG